MGILGKLRLCGNEVVMTRAIGVLLNESPAFATQFLGAFFSASSPTDVNAECEVGVGEYGRIDLVVTWREGAEMHCAVVEHKIKAGEGEEQTSRYRSAAAGLWASRTFDSTPKANSHPHLLFLALFPWDLPKHGDFVAGTHRDMIPALDAAASEGTSTISTLAGEWADELRSFYVRDEAHASLPWRESLKIVTPGGLPSGYMVAGQIAVAMGSQLNAAGLSVNNIYRGSGQGRSWLGLVIERDGDAWRCPLRPEAGAEPSAYMHFQVHLPLDSDDRPVARIALELLPYRPQRQARGLYSDLFVDAYRGQRSGLISSVRAALDQRGWKVTDKWNYLASKRLAGNARSVEELSADLASTFVAETEILDAAWTTTRFRTC